MRAQAVPVFTSCGFDHFLRQRLLTSSDVVVRPRTPRFVTSFEGTCPMQPSRVGGSQQRCHKVSRSLDLAPEGRATVSP